MLLFLPHLILGATLLILIASNIFQRGFRSSWLLTAAGTGLALASLVFLRLQLPVGLGSSAWWAGEGLVSSISFSLDAVSWQFALIVCSLSLAFFLVQVHKAVNEPWLNWAVSLALAGSSLFALVSDDLLTFAFLWILVDTITALWLLRLVTKATERYGAFDFLLPNVAASFLLMAANVLVAYGGDAANLLILIAAAMRLELFTPLLKEIQSDQQSIRESVLRLLPMTSVFVLLTRLTAFSGPMFFVALIFISLFALINVFHWLQKNNHSGIEYFERGFAALALLASALGQSGAVFAFGLFALVGSSVLYLAQNAGRFRWLVIVPSALILVGLPFRQIIEIEQATAVPSWPAIVFLPLLALLVAGWMRKAPQSSQEEPYGEPWMRSIRWLGLFVIPVVFLVFILVSPPSLTQETEFIWWPAAGVLILTLLSVFALEGAQPKLSLSTNWSNFFQVVLSMAWLKAIGSAILNALDWILRMMNRILEGQAGILWALLLIALLLSVASQFVLGG
jgi:hypothetical protein